MKNWLYTLFLLSASVFAAPHVVVSIKPIHDVALAVMEGAGTPTLLVPPGASPHHYALAPSQARALYDADLVIWIGPDLETFLTQPLSHLKKEATLLTLTEINGMTLYPFQTDHDHDHDHGSVDPHLWLSLPNLIQYAQALEKTLTQLDPQNSSIYQANTTKTVEHLKALDLSLKQALLPAAKIPIMVFHDAYQYFTKRYGLNVVGTIVLRADTMPSVSRVLEIQQTLKSQKVQCIFSEPQFQPAIVERLVGNSGISAGVLDPLGAPSPTGLAGIETLFHQLAHNIVTCVKP